MSFAPHVVVAAFHIPFFLGFALFIVAPLMALGVYFDKKRTAALREAASELHLEFFPKAEPLNLTELAGFHLMQQGGSRRFRNLMRGSAEGIDLDIFDYEYTTGSGKNSTTFYTSVARFHAPELALPIFQIRPEGLLTKIGKVFGYQDIDFAEHAAFSKTFLLRGPDEAAIRALFDDELIVSLEPMRSGISVEGAGAQLIFYRLGKRVEPNAVRAFFTEAFSVFSRFSDAGKRAAA